MNRQRAKVAAEEAKRMAEMGLRHLRVYEAAGDMHGAFGSAWFTLASIAGMPDLPLPHVERRAALQQQKGTDHVQG